MTRLILILGDQLSQDVAALREADRDGDVIVMAEVRGEATYVAHHPKKIAFVFAAMRHFAKDLRDAGWTVAYTAYDEAENSHTISGELLRRAEELGAREVIATRPGEWRVIAALDDLPLKVTQQPDNRFICSQEGFESWAKDRKELRMEYFYRQMRRKTGLLMDGDAPEGGKWNFDKQNRKPASPDLFRKGPAELEPDDITSAVLDLVEQEFPDNFGRLRPFALATNRAGAVQALDHFVEHALPEFGAYQDAMLQDDPVLYHALLSPYLNTGLLAPLEVCEAVERVYKDGKVPLNSAEGFIRQIIGWREFLRGIYFMEGPGYTGRNALKHDRKLPAAYWGDETRMNCLAHAVAQTRDLAYAHHIQRLMVTGNFALLAGIDPAEVHDWYLSVYIDAFEWVEAPNTIGMSQFADGGIVASKPYISSGSYIDRMSDYCGNCHYAVTERHGETACPFNSLYWHFLERHRDRFKENPRMALVYGNWDRMQREDREDILAAGDAVLAALDAAEVV